MQPLDLMQKFASLLEGDKINITEKELAVMSELSIIPLVQKEFTHYSNGYVRVFKTWINPMDFLQLKKDALIEDLTFIASVLKTIDVTDVKIHEFIDFVITPKLFIFGDSKKQKALQEEITSRVFDNLHAKELVKR